MPSIPNIIVVDDYEFYRKGIILTLKRYMQVKVTGQAANGQECLKILNKLPVDIILMDIRMHGMDGIETAKKALLIKPSLKIIGMTDDIEEVNLKEIVKIGFAGFLSKDMRSDDLKHALQNIIHDKGFYSPALVNVMIEKKKIEKNPATHITKREKEIVQLIAQGWYNREIADKFKVSLRTVTNHRANMYKKFGVNNTVKLLNWANKYNLI